MPIQTFTCILTIAPNWRHPNCSTAAWVNKLQREVDFEIIMLKEATANRMISAICIKLQELRSHLQTWQWLERRRSQRDTVSFLRLHHCHSRGLSRLTGRSVEPEDQQVSILALSQHWVLWRCASVELAAPSGRDSRWSPLCSGGPI